MSQQSVLVFTRDQALDERLTNYLKLCGFAAFSAMTVAEGLEVMRLLQPKVVVLDPTTKEAVALLRDTSTNWQTISVVALVHSEVAAQKARDLGIEEVVIGDDAVADEVSLLLKEPHLYPESDRERILVVDDETEIVEMLSSLLTRRGYEVVTADSGQKALEIVAHDSEIDLVLLDVTLPGMGGLETLQALKRWQPDLKVIMMSALADAALAGFAGKLGAFDFVLKPIDPDQLEQRIIACNASEEFRRLPWWKRLA